MYPAHYFTTTSTYNSSTYGRPKKAFVPEALPEEKQTENEVELDDPIRQLSFSELIIFMHIDNK